ncbi:MAG: type II toxin-antitoxin system death-on-curing family toxin [Euryarchaeota archaeon]|nr:type II toxin-antitoxin system death-on-curing family toxin [Euryarchaeota archaeon]
MQIHEETIALAGGARGILMPGAVDAALDRVAWGPFPESGDLFERAALLLRGLVLDHPFVDGNKRTAFFVTAVFLEKNGYGVRGRVVVLKEFMLSVARGDVDVAAITGWIRENSVKL